MNALPKKLQRFCRDTIALWLVIMKNFKKYVKKLRQVFKLFVLSFSVVFLLILGFIFTKSPEQCPESYSQAQIEETNCVVGASILPYYSWPLILAIGGSVAVVVVVYSKKKE